MADSPLPTSSPPPLAPILRLPIELRQQIYTYLLPRENVSHPLPSVGITSVSHRPPSTALLNIHPTLTAEILDAFYARATWKLILSHAFNFFRVDPELRRLAASPSLAHLRHVEVVFFCDVLLMREYPSFGMQGVRAEIRRRAARACEVLGSAARLRRVTVSWIDTTEAGMWAADEDPGQVLEPLRDLAEGRRGEQEEEEEEERDGKEPTISFRVGEIYGPGDVDREGFAKVMRDVLGPGHTVETQVDEIEEKNRASQYRMLAFDVRQDRPRISGHPGSFPSSGTRRSGWRGAPPLLNALPE